jgi:hypothetical protein
MEAHAAGLVCPGLPVNLPERPALPLDPVLSAYLLSLPAFTGGTLTLAGLWPDDMPEAQAASRLLAWGGVTLTHDRRSITATAAREAFRLPLPGRDLSPDLGPLYLALLARRQALTGDSAIPHNPPPFPRAEEDSVMAGDFFSRLALAYSPGTLCRVSDAGENTARDGAGKMTASPPAIFEAGRAYARPEQRPDASGLAPEWICPDGLWGMAYALAALVRPGLKLGNPGAVTEVLPSFWKLYNSLPNLADPIGPVGPGGSVGQGGREQEKEQEAPAERPARRRVIAD